MHELADQLLSYLRACWHYRWFGVVIAWIIAPAGWIAVYRMPDRFEASARVWVDTQSVIKNLLAGLTAQPNVNQTVGMVSRTLISRPNLEKVIRMADKDFELKTSEELQPVITRLTKEVTIQSAGGENLFTIAYTDNDSQRAMRVVQGLLTIFEEGSRNDQRKDSEAARRFIDEELKTSKEKLDVAENAVIEFRRRQLLVVGGRGDYTRLVEAQAALSEATLEFKIAETSRDAIKKNFSDETEIPSLLGEKSASVGVHPEIDALEQKLDALRLNYTEQHPDIVALVRTIAQLKEQKNAEVKPRKPSPSPSAAQAVDTGYRPLALSLAAAEANVAAAKERVAEYGKRYDELKAAAIAAPQTDADYTQLAREYEMAKSNYGALLTRRETARISGEMETRTSATDFRVIDPPRVPSVPKAPNRQMLNSLVLLMALGGGVGLAFVLSQIRPTFNDERRLKEVSGLQVFGTVIMARTDAQEARRARGLVGFLISFASLLSAYAAIMVALGLTVSRV
jgi:polysaccharide chain length determinant protein (PEP-CTERM system associated)